MRTTKPGVGVLTHVALVAMPIIVATAVGCSTPPVSDPVPGVLTFRPPGRSRTAG